MTRQPTSRYCFVCGRENPVGLHLSWVNDREKMENRGTLTVPEHFQGYPGVVHGGIVATILDETAGRAVMLTGGHDKLMVTLKLEVTYRRPTPTNVLLTAVGRVVRDTGRRAQVEAELRLPDGTVTASASAVVVSPPDAIRASWNVETADWRVADPGDPIIP